MYNVIISALIGTVVCWATSAHEQKRLPMNMKIDNKMLSIEQFKKFANEVDLHSIDELTEVAMKCSENRALHRRLTYLLKESRRFVTRRNLWKIDETLKLLSRTKKWYWI